MKTHHQVIQLPPEIKKLQRLRDKYRRWAKTESGWRPLARLATAVVNDLEQYYLRGPYYQSVESQIPKVVERHLPEYFADLEALRSQQRELLRKQILSLTTDLDRLSTLSCEDSLMRQVRSLEKHELLQKISGKQADLATQQRPLDLEYLREHLEFEFGLPRQPRTKTPRLTHP
jgi:hypothetical protein